MSDDLYREEILEHYKHPHNFGELSKATVTVREANASCGDLIELQLLVRSGTIVKAKFKGVGCALSLATASILTDDIQGKTVGEALRFDEQRVIALLGTEVSPMRRKCVLLPLRALDKALEKISK